MQSPEIPVALVQQLVAEQFPQWAALPVTPVAEDGWDNRTFRLGDTMSVRLPSAAGYAAQVATEQRWLPKLAPHLPLPIPTPLAQGQPATNYPWPWSIYRWQAGASATADRIADLPRFATTLARFLSALYRIDPSDGPAPGPHNFYRGGSLLVYDSETRQALATLRDAVPTKQVLAIWQAALAAEWHNPPVWIHGDVSAANLLVQNGELSAVIDFGCMGVGDPACDLTIAWTLFHGPSRAAFRAGLALDAATWTRARGWALWKALITLAADRTLGQPRYVISQLLLGDH